GVCRAGRVTTSAGGLLLHPFTLTSKEAVYFLWHWPADCSEWVLPTIMPCGVRTFLDFMSRSSATPSRGSQFSELCPTNVVSAITLKLMLILLPPSEGKTAPEDGPSLDFNDLVFPGLSGERRTVIHELQVDSSLAEGEAQSKRGSTMNEKQ